jgi:coproporphyrinogen III oxidase
VINIIRIFIQNIKKQCDGYFGTHIAMKHAEVVVFDYCKAQEEPMQDWFNFVSEVGDSFLSMFQ